MTFESDNFHTNKKVNYCNYEKQYRPCPPSLCSHSILKTSTSVSQVIFTCERKETVLEAVTSIWKILFEVACLLDHPPSHFSLS